MKFAPIILFVYNRLEHTRKTISHLVDNEGAKDSELYIFSDGPKDIKAENQVDEIRNYIRGIQGFKNVHIFCRNENAGLQKSIVSGVQEIIKEHRKAIVLEDDVITNHNFLRYMNYALEMYEDDKDVFSISGYAFVDFHTKKVPDVYFLSLTSSWGWATWKDRWEKLDMKASGWEELRDNKGLRNRFNLEGGYDWYSILVRQTSERAYNSWAICWYWTVFKNRGLTLFPKTSLVENIGFDGSGVHCGDDNIKFRLDPNARIENLKTDIEENMYIRKKVSFYMKIDKIKASVRKYKKYIRKTLNFANVCRR